MEKTEKDLEEYGDLEREKKRLISDLENMRPEVQETAQFAIDRMNEMQKEILARGNIRVEVAPNGNHIVSYC